MIGRHLLLEHWGGIQDADTIEAALHGAAGAAGATVLSAHLHPFEGGGLTGVLLLAESHITIHTWPEHDYAALDLFMCGTARIEAAADHLDAVLAPTRTSRRLLTRGERAPGALT
ncbi:adenosylmethionine decarboxylase [Jannaschia seohaensis]|uniref:S-adenosylmethionine decarboxylase n=1 Tax=Jannaschia seohaensis TaxID=475081 RepID=A0A2Y9ARV5_9RHOB|nr:adenosylmethionine decarboxylase [Jannaschia seohaensis]PWJ18290.1 S-adenosylmethionine decarboxylase [Jannaschia seohaensis]SSA46815.1 S-adenosylmethionine decarboxylase [Jannaschia seohaensis]